MSSFKEVRELLLVAYESKVLSLMKNISECSVLFEQFELKNMQDDECFAEFGILLQDSVLK